MLLISVFVFDELIFRNSAFCSAAQHEGF